MTICPLLSYVIICLFLGQNIGLAFFFCLPIKLMQTGLFSTWFHNSSVQMIIGAHEMCVLIIFINYIYIQVIRIPFCLVLRLFLMV